MKTFLQSVVLSILVLISVGLKAESCIPQKQSPPRLVNDFADLLSPSLENQLERRLIDFNDTTSTQITIVTVNSLCDDEASSFAFELGEQWGVGNKKFDNGVVILVKPKLKNSKGHAFIATGYGLEGVLPDAISKRIVENEMIAQFKRNDYEQGIINGVLAVIEITGGEYSAEQYNSRNKKGAKPFPLFPLIVVLFFAFIMLFGTIGRARKYSQRNNTSLWLALMLMGSTRNRHRGYYDNFGSGSGGFGGFGGGSGGFGGFGGGSFGGGGAGGSW